MKLFRWKAIVPMLLLAIIVTVVWLLFVDRIIRKSIEFVGTELVGAKVELASATLRLRQGDLVLKGLQVTNPNAPMTNLMDIPEMTADLNVRALLLKKAVVESLVVHGVRFGTPRQTSGALPDLPPTAGLVTRRVLAWANSIPVPTLDLAGVVGTVVRIPAISADSLRTLREGRAAVARADSLRTAWEQSLRGLDPRPQIDSARALATRLQATDPRSLNAAQLATTANDIRTSVNGLKDLETRLASARSGVDSSLAAVKGSVSALDAARQADYNYARGLVHIPSLAGPDVSMALFGDMMKERLKPVLYWIGIAEEHVPPGLDPRRQQGAKRLRMDGTDYIFPLEHALPQFLVERAEADLAIGGQTVAAGAYRAEVRGATNEPAVYGRPLFFSAARTSTVGPRDLSVRGMMDRTGRIALDSLNALVPDIQLAAIPIPKAAANLDFGDSAVVTLGLKREGTDLRGVMEFHSEAVHWRRDADSAATTGPAPRLGSKEWAEGLLWRSISSIRNVGIQASIGGSLTSPSLSVSSNVGDAVSASLRRELGAELQRAEQSIRAEVDKQINAVTTQARAKATELETMVAQRLGVPSDQLKQVQAELEQQLGRYTQVPGVRLPNIPGIPRPPRP